MRKKECFMAKQYKRLFRAPDHSFFLFGPRGTGKSTLVETEFPDEIFVNLILPDVLRTFLARPEYLFYLIEAEPHKKVVIIDEIQKAPSLLSVVHALVEQKRGLKFILTGSSARKLKRVEADLLGGRALRCTLHPFMAKELGTDFKLETALEKGMLPLVAEATVPKLVLDAYISLYLHEEIQAEGLVRNLESFSRFLEIVSFSHGGILNVSNISRECAVKRKTVENYLSILDELLLSFQLNVFDKRAQRQLSAHQKFYLFDTGVFRALRPKSLLDKAEEIEGAALEGLVAQHLIAWNDYSTEKNQIAFWRTRSGVEVDFIINGPSGLFAIEVKNGTQIHSQDLRALKEFKKDYPIAELIFLYRGKERLKIDDVLCLPCEEFLLSLSPGIPIIGSG